MFVFALIGYEVSVHARTSCQSTEKLQQIHKYVFFFSGIDKVLVDTLN